MTDATDKPKRYKRRQTILTPVAIRDARDALEETSTLISIEKQPVLWNFTIAALALCDALAGLRDDIETVHRKLDRLEAEQQLRRR
jgi:hypothetical protein